MKHLGICTGSQLAIRCVIPVAAAVTAEVVTDHSSHMLINDRIEKVLKPYREIYPDMTKMPSKATSEMLKELEQIRKENPPGGIVTRWANHLHTEVMTDSIFSNVKHILYGPKPK